MKLHKLAQATTMWLPGFAPDEASSNDAPAPLVQIEEPAPSLARIGLARKVKPAAPPKEVWPALRAETLVSGTVTRFEANIAAMRTLKNLEAEGRAPTAEEAEVLTRFSGWGSFPQLFAWAPKGGEWDGRQEALRNVLDEKEIEAAKASTPNSHYTSPVVIEAMWQAVSRLGFKGGRVLEPSAGAGYFIGAMPTELAQASTITAVELDPVPARITKALYGRYGVKVLNEALEKTNLPDGFFDLVIGNVPFGNYPVSDAKGRWAGMSIHNYFILRALEMCREGGLVAVITSSYTLEASMGRKARAEMARLGELVSAVRLPMSAFRAVAGTDVTTDLLIFQRKAAPATAGAWVDSSVRVPAEMALNAYQAPRHNAYFGEHPEAVLGKVRMGGQRGGTLEVVFDGDLGEALAERVAALPEGIVPEAGRINEVEVAPREVMVASAEWVKPGAYVVTTDGALAQSVDGQNLRVLSDLTTAKERRLRGVIPVRDALRQLLAFQASSDDDALLERYQIALRASYEAFVKAFGPISKPFNTSAYRDDPDFPLLLSLEHWDAETGEATKADVFHKRTVGMRHRVERCETPEEALLVCLSENAKVVPSRIAELLTMDEDAAVHALLDAGLVFRNPMGARLEQSAIYLSGDVKTKLMQAEFAAEDDAEYLRNVEALKEVIPADIQAGDIGLKLGATWVPASVIVSFIGEALDAAIYTAPRVSYDKNAGTWKVSLNAPPKAQQEWATERVRLESLLDLAMNGQEPRVTDPDPNDPEGKKRVVNVEQTAAAKDRLEAIKSAFADWVWKDEARTELLVRIYNDRFNRIVRAAYDGSHLTLPGFSGAYVLRQHQSDAVWRCLVSGVNTLLAHVVGAGKTLTMICAGMEMRRTGMASKPCYVVPNHMLEQFAAEFLRAYPAASVLVANKDDMAPAKRKALLARMAVGNWDAVVMTHSSFERVPVPKDYTESMIDGKLRDMELAYMEAKGDNDTRAVKDLAKRRKVWQVRLERMAEGKGKDDLLDFAEVGFDALFVDEFHLHKNLFRPTRMRMAGLPTNDALRAFDMEVKTGYVMQRRGDGRGVVAATGTPIANSVSEMWVMQHYLQPQTLEAYGIEQFDTWAANFGESVTAMELAPDGGRYRINTRFARFVNVPELLTLFTEVADIKTGEMLDLPVPVAIREIVTAQPTETVKQYVRDLMDRVDAIKAGMVKPWEDNMLAVTTDGRKAATDIRLCNIDEDAPESKVNLLVGKIMEIWSETAAKKGTQLVFLDAGTPQGTGWSLYADIRKKLLAAGMPEGEVAFIHDANTDKAKEALFESVRAGRVRVLLGSTAKMGTGTNVQTRLVAIHHADAPWRPADVEQRDGRGIRQGNTSASVRILRYVTAGTFDAYVWQTLETKAKFIGQVMRGDAGLRSIEDAEMGALSYAEVKAIASGNPLVIEKAGVDAEVMRLSMLKSAWMQRRANSASQVASLPGIIKRTEAAISAMKADAVAAAKMRDGLQMAVGARVLADEEQIAKRILAVAYSVEPGKVVKVGDIGPFTLHARGAFHSTRAPRCILQGGGEYEIEELGKTPRGVIAQIHGLLARIDSEVRHVEARLEERRETLSALRAALDVPFEHEENLNRLLARKAMIDAELCPTATETVDVGDELAMAA